MVVHLQWDDGLKISQHVLSLCASIYIFTLEKDFLGLHVLHIQAQGVINIYNYCKKLIEVKITHFENLRIEFENFN